MNERIRVLVADAEESFRNSVANEIACTSGLELVGQTGDGEELLQMIRKLRPQVLVMDLVLTGVDGIAVLEQMRTRRPKILVMSAFIHSTLVEQLLKYGVDYFMLKPCHIPILAERVRQLAAGHEPARRLLDREPPYHHELWRKSTAILQELGIPAHLKGYHYLREAISLTVEDVNTFRSVTKMLYPTVARRYNTTSSRVERAIRCAIGTCWKKGSRETLLKYFGCVTGGSCVRPSNSAFIAMIADRLSLEPTREDAG